MGYISRVVQYILHAQCCASLSLPCAWRLSGVFNVLALDFPWETGFRRGFLFSLFGFGCLLSGIFRLPVSATQNLFIKPHVQCNPPPQSQVNGLEVTTWPKLGNKGFHTRNLKLEHLETNQVVSGAQVTILRWLWWKMRWEWWSSERRRLN